VLTRSRIHKGAVLALLLTALSLTLAHAASDWRRSASILATGEGDTVAAKNELQKLPDLDKTLSQSLQQGGRDEYLALSVIGALARDGLIPSLMDRIKAGISNAQLRLHYFQTLAHFTQSPHTKEIADFFRSQVSLTDPKQPSTLRILALDYLSEVGEKPELSTLAKLLDDSDYRVRMTAMRVIEDGFESKDASQYIPILQKALVISPYPVRIRAAHLAGRLTPAQRAPLQDAIHKCSQDERSEVRALCLELSHHP
jgi:hypothetical protein